MIQGAEPWAAAGYLGMSVKTLIDTYGHHHPDYMKDAAAAITAKRTPAKRSISPRPPNRVAQKGLTVMAFIRSGKCSPWNGCGMYERERT
jgi:hypothetical protein